MGEKKPIVIPDTYSLEQRESIHEIESEALVLRHKLSGARVLLLSNEDENKVFSIGFRTPPEDATGVPHIIEHTVLCGSKNFPAKDPFVELVKGSLNTYLNATTYPDKTLYPVASCNDKDFENLMHVYMDAVFYPNIYKEEKIFKQEGWHYELEDEKAPVIYNGVVYNEMKGAFSSEESVLERIVMNGLFPDTTYGQESGGDPECIPDLTYQDYLQFHKQYYHPVNSYIYLYGNMDVEERLRCMDENYLKDFSKIELDSTIGMQSPFKEVKFISKPYPVSENADCEEKTYYSYGAAMDLTMDQEACRAFELLSYILVEMPGAPLKQAILDAGLGNDVDVDFCDITRQSYFSISTKNAKAGLRDKFYQVIRETLQDVVEKGIDRKALEAALNGTEFREREADFGAFPKGLLYGLKSMKTWLYDDEKALDSLYYEKYYVFLREQLNTDYYEKLIQTYLLDNTHAVLVEMIPEAGLVTRIEEKEIERLKSYKESLSKQEIEDLIAETKALKLYQETPTSKEDLEKIPMLSVQDISKDVQPYHNEEKEILGIKTVHHNLHTNDIIYLGLYFNVSDMEEYVPQMSFLATLLGYMDTENFTYQEFDTETNFYTGGISSDFTAYRIMGSESSYELKFEVRTKVLRSQMESAMKLIAEMMFHTIFKDEKHLREVVAETRSRLKVRLMSSGHQAAASRIGAYHSKTGWINDASVGMGYYEYLVQMDEHFEEEKQALIEGCEALVRAMFSKERMLISCTCDEEGFQAVEKIMPEFCEKIQTFAGQEARKLSSLKRYEVTPNVLNEGFMTPAKVQYVAVGGSFGTVAKKNIGALKVVKHLLNYEYLWNEVRVKGGAYGVGCQFSREGEGYFTSYRDPNLTSTLEIYKKAAAFLRDFSAEEREVQKTIIGTISGMDTPMTPAMKGRRSMAAYFTKTPLGVLQKEREQVLSCNLDDIRSSAEVVEAIVNAGNVCVIGNEKRIKEEQQNFKELKTLS